MTVPVGGVLAGGYLTYASIHEIVPITGLIGTPPVSPVYPVNSTCVLGFFTSDSSYRLIGTNGLTGPVVVTDPAHYPYVVSHGSGVFSVFLANPVSTGNSTVYRYQANPDLSVTLLHSDSVPIWTGSLNTMSFAATPTGWMVLGPPTGDVSTDRLRAVSGNITTNTTTIGLPFDFFAATGHHIALGSATFSGQAGMVQLRDTNISLVITYLATQGFTIDSSCAITLSSSVLPSVGSGGAPGTFNANGTTFQSQSTFGIDAFNDVTLVTVDGSGNVSGNYGTPLGVPDNYAYFSTSINNCLYYFPQQAGLQPATFMQLLYAPASAPIAGLVRARYPVPAGLDPGTIRWGQIVAMGGGTTVMVFALTNTGYTSGGMYITTISPSLAPPMRLGQRNDQNRTAISPRLETKYKPTSKQSNGFGRVDGSSGVYV